MLLCDFFFGFIYTFTGCSGSASLCGLPLAETRRGCGVWTAPHRGLLFRAWALGQVGSGMEAYGSFPDQGSNCVPCIARRPPNHWATREVPPCDVWKKPFIVDLCVGVYVCRRGDGALDIWLCDISKGSSLMHLELNLKAADPWILSFIHTCQSSWALWSNRLTIILKEEFCCFNLRTDQMGSKEIQLHP